jgi:hypothetical protein
MEINKIPFTGPLMALKGAFRSRQSYRFPPCCLRKAIWVAAGFSLPGHRLESLCCHILGGQLDNISASKETFARGFFEKRFSPQGGDGPPS